MNSIGDGVIAADVTGTTRFVNRVAAELTGWSQDDARGRSLDEVFRIVGADHLPAENPVARVLEQGTLAGRANHTILIRRDGAEFPIEIASADDVAMRKKVFLPCWRRIDFSQSIEVLAHAELRAIFGAGEERRFSIS